jgi:D-beta-D-heptose 7-phosphate kinase/D-beta-D-heptose 1-phosphate adenosyltransferase
VIVATSDLPGLRQAVAMVDGGFDPLHAGHIDYFREASGLGLPVLCNVSGDRYVASKHAPLLPEEQRVRVIDAIRYIAYTHLSQTTTAEILELLRPRYYVKGSDWQDRLPSEEVATCERNGTGIVFLDTVVDSSSRLLEAFVSGAVRSSAC